MGISPSQERAAIEYITNLERRAADCLKIRDKSGRTVPLAFSPAQRKLDALWRKMESQNRPVRIIALKPRQVHMSVGVAAEIFLRVPFYPGQQSMVMADTDDTTTTLFDYYKQFQESYQPSLLALGNDALPGLLKDTDHHLRWANDSSIECRTSGGKNVGRGRSRRFLHFSEYAFATDAEKVMRGVMSSIPEEPGTGVVLESTANGLGGSFWERCQEAMRAGSLWEFLFFAWWEHPEYSATLLGPAAKFQDSMAKDELEIWQRYGLSLEQMNWRRKVLGGKFKGDIDGFMQEFPSNPEEAFLMSGRPRFNVKAIARQNVIRDPIRGNLKVETVGAKDRTLFLPDDRGNLEIFKRARPDSRYVIGADPAKGKEETGSKDPDWSVACVLEVETGEQVAKLRERLTPWFFAEQVVSLGRLYNLAYLVPEANDDGFIHALLQQDYPLGKFFERKPDAANMRPPTAQEIGWYESTTTRPMLISVLEGALLDGSIFVRSQNTVSELMSFVVKPNGRAEHQTGCHDDEVFALALAVMGLQAIPRDAPRHKFPLVEEQRPTPQTLAERAGYAMSRRSDQEAGEWEVQRYR